MVPASYAIALAISSGLACFIVGIAVGRDRR